MLSTRRRRHSTLRPINLPPVCLWCNQNHVFSFLPQLVRVLLLLNRSQLNRPICACNPTDSRGCSRVLFSVDHHTSSIILNIRSFATRCSSISRRLIYSYSVALLNLHALQLHGFYSFYYGLLSPAY